MTRAQLLQVCDLLQRVTAAEISRRQEIRADVIIKAAAPAIASLVEQVDKLAERVDVLAAVERIRMAQIEYLGRCNFAKYSNGHARVEG
jgi:hypothetical protein